MSQVRSRIAGIDEAGKGCVIGPLVVAGVCLEQVNEGKLRKMGVRDSKKIPHQRRIELADKIRRVARVEVVKVDAEKLDEMMKHKTINEILKDCFAELILNLRPDVVFVDSPDVIPDRLATELEKITGCRVVAEHRADEKYIVVSAASIIAKVEREKEIEKIKEIAGDFGSGYASDPLTREFLRKLVSQGKLPGYVRKRWKTVSNLSQQSLEDFC
jgi:ribonuclease HII